MVPAPAQRERRRDTEDPRTDDGYVAHDGRLLARYGSRARGPAPEETRRCTHLSRSTLSLALLAGCAAPQVPALGMPAPGQPGSSEDALAIAQAAFEPGDLPAVPRRGAPADGVPAELRLGPVSDGPEAGPRAPTTSVVLEGEKLGHDPSVAVGDRYLVVYTAHRYHVRDKATGELVAPLSGSEVAPVGDFSTLFSPLWAPRDKRGAPNPANINTRLRLVAGDPLRCDPEDPLGPASPACVREFYDTRVLWDGQRKRFWIESAVRNHLWFCTRTATQPCADPKHSATQPRRFIAVAVSRTEDPRQGFHRYVLVDEYSDWPKMGLHDRYLLLGHRNSTNLYVFDADRLAAGNPDHGPVRLAKLDARAFPGARFLDEVNQHGPAGDVTLLVGTDGSDHLTMFGLWNPDPSRAVAPRVIAGPRVSVAARLGSFENNAVYRDGRVYLTMDECTPGHDGCGPRRIRVLRLPVTVEARDGERALAVTTDPARGYLDATFGGREPDDAPGDVADYVKPALDVTAAGDVVVGYARRSFKMRAEQPFELRYSILYHGEAAPRPGVVVRRGTWMEAPDLDDNGKAGIDLAGAQTDPGDERTVWISHAVADGQLRWFRQWTAAVRP